MTTKTLDTNALEALDVEPVGTWILAESIEQVTESEGGILLPETSSTESRLWLVHKVGPGGVSGTTGEHLTAMMHGIEPGDVVVAGSQGWGVGLKERRDYALLKVADIVGVYRGAGL